MTAVGIWDVIGLFKC